MLWKNRSIVTFSLTNNIFYETLCLGFYRRLFFPPLTCNDAIRHFVVSIDAEFELLTSLKGKTRNL